jgi:hypothetical protein
MPETSVPSNGHRGPVRPTGSGSLPALPLRSRRGQRRSSDACRPSCPSLRGMRDEAPAAGANKPTERRTPIRRPARRVLGVSNEPGPNPPYPAPARSVVTPAGGLVPCGVWNAGRGRVWRVRGRDSRATPEAWAPSKVHLYPDSGWKCTFDGWARVALRNTQDWKRSGMHYAASRRSSQRGELTCAACEPPRLGSLPSQSI